MIDKYCFVFPSSEQYLRAMESFPAIIVIFGGVLSRMHALCGGRDDLNLWLQDCEVEISDDFTLDSKAIPPHHNVLPG